MAAVKDPREALAVWPIMASGRALYSLIMLVVVALIVQIGTARWFSPEPAERLGQLLADAQKRAADPVLARQAADVLYQPLGVWTRLDAVVRRQQSDGSLTPAQRVLHPWILAYLYAVQLIGTRLAALLACFELLLVLVLVAGIDGLVQRAIRVEEAGRESATKFNLAKAMRKVGLPLGCLLYVAAPFTVDPGWIMGPLMVVVVGSVWGQASWMRKYL
ncbi:DUF4400 domain-containing protein [Parachitinimonas caeni]|uniref:DUF4400 domain-containing protein n=1 Tax=Parachitinimonas caeni TaxID=3031301 RepID=A0ABT7E1X8_9NEIS|nr:DUF4400 domain-containing protein [Parachitinimonas caeni]MDK2126254.1 DUF4400 domain-containing protein [Parachitinimonas caeni]